MNLTIKEVDRNWKDKDERGFGAISFSIPEKPNDEIYLVEDLGYPKTFNFHMIGGNNLGDSEILFLAKAVISFIQPGYYLTSCGESWEQKERLYKVFEKLPGLDDTGYLRVLKDKEDKNHYYKIFKKKNDNTKI